MIVAALWATQGLTSFGLLSQLLTSEGLLFAALTVGVSLSTPRAPPSVQARGFTPVALAFLAVAVLAILAAAALLAWTDVFLGSKRPSGWNRRFEAVALGVAVVAQPLLALLIAVGLWRG